MSNGDIQQEEVYVYPGLAEGDRVLRRWRNDAGENAATGTVVAINGGTTYVSFDGEPHEAVFIGNDRMELRNITPEVGAENGSLPGRVREAHEVLDLFTADELTAHLIACCNPGTLREVARRLAG